MASNDIDLGVISEIILNTPGFYGSNPGNYIICYSVIEKNVGSDLVYTADTVNGDYITVVTPGVYAVTEMMTFGAASNSGVSLNANSLLDQLNMQNNSAIFIYQYFNSGQQVTTSRTAVLQAGDIIRSHGDSATFSGFAYSRLIVTRIG